MRGLVQYFTNTYQVLVKDSIITDECVSQDVVRLK